MARKPLRPCRHPGCGVLTAGGWCGAHRPKRIERGADSASWQWMYRTDLWRKELRPNQLAREPFCRECARRGIREYATDVDHVEPHMGDWTKFADPENLQSLCHSCHSRKTLEELRQSRAKGG